MEITYRINGMIGCCTTRMEKELRQFSTKMCISTW